MRMIERLHGILVERHPTFAVIECGGVGYGVQISARTGERLPAEGTEITLLTHLVVREDAMELFGFADTQEKELFLSMITVNGVGPKTAQRILSSVSPGDFLSIIARGDKAALGKIKGKRACVQIFFVCEAWITEMNVRIDKTWCHHQTCDI